MNCQSLQRSLYTIGHVAVANMGTIQCQNIVLSIVTDRLGSIAHHIFLVQRVHLYTSHGQMVVFNGLEGIGRREDLTLQLFAVRTQILQISINGRCGRDGDGVAVEVPLVFRDVAILHSLVPYLGIVHLFRRQLGQVDNLHLALTIILSFFWAETRLLQHVNK